VSRRRGSRRGSDAGLLTESYRVMRANLSVAMANIEHQVIMITSAVPGEGKTSTVANLAPLLAVAGHRVVVVDLDLRHPDLHNALGLANERGASDVLSGRAELGECMQYVAVKSEAGHGEQGMYVLPSGPTPPDPGELVADRRAARMLQSLAEQADIVLVDSPPVIPVSDSLTLARIVSGVVLVVEARRTPIPLIQDARDALAGNQARILGVVLNKLRPRDVRGAEGTSVGRYGYTYTA
jgi:capsular exopolysaccharide synthesis family protein